MDNDSLIGQKASRSRAFAMRVLRSRKNYQLALNSELTDLDQRAKKQARKAIKNRTLFERSEFGRFQLFERKFFERDGRSLDLFCLLFCVKAKRVSGFKGNAL